jgi:galactose mutarotase-like enzyme
MSVTHETISIASRGLSAEISALGAEMVKLTDAQGRDLLWSGDPLYWKGRAPILFPVVGAVKGGHYRYDGKDYPLARHGFARTRRFEIVSRDPQQAVMRLESDKRTRAEYPFDFKLDMTYAVEGPRLDVTARVENCGTTAMPASFGFHPAFRWPLPYGRSREDHRIYFARTEKAPIRRLNGDGLIEHETVPNPVDGRELVLHDELFTHDALIFDQLASRSLTYSGSDGPVLSIAFSNLSQLGLWTKPGAGFICIEPWQGTADLAGYEGDIRDKPGIVEIAAGATREFAMSVTVSRGGIA